MGRIACNRATARVEDRGKAGMTASSRAILAVARTIYEGG